MTLLLSVRMEEYIARNWNELYTIVILAMIAVAIFGAILRGTLRSTFKKYGSVANSTGKSGSQVARELLNSHGCGNIAVGAVQGELTDNYNPSKGLVSLSSSVANDASVAAMAVAAHECGHACQYNEGYSFIGFRNAVLPVARFASNTAPFLILFGFILDGWLILAEIGVGLYFAILLFQLLTLPLEFNASKRAMAMLSDGGYISSEEERTGARKVLTQAALTYVIGTLATLLSILRLLLIIFARSGGRRRR